MHQFKWNDRRDKLTKLLFRVRLQKKNLFPFMKYHLIRFKSNVWQCGAAIILLYYMQIGRWLKTSVQSFVFDCVHYHQIAYFFTFIICSRTICIDLSFVVLTSNRWIQMHRHFHSMPSKLTLTSRKSIAVESQSECVNATTINKCTISKINEEKRSEKMQNASGSCAYLKCYSLNVSLSVVVAVSLRHLIGIFASLQRQVHISKSSKFD